MSLDADAAVDRRRLKRHLTFWRVLAIVALAGLAIALYGRVAGLPAKDHIARLSVTGVIRDDPDRDRALDGVAKNPRIPALVVRIDSPGGTVVGGETLFHKLRAIGRRKPVVAVMGEIATSAGYMTALGAERIFAREGTLTGSIGVLLQTAEISGLLDKLGISTEAIKSAPLKAEPSPFEPLDETARKATQRLVDDIFRMFVDMVAERRGLSRRRALELADGRVFTGGEALDRNLIDAIGGEDDALLWLESTHGIDADLPVHEVEIEREDTVWRELMQAIFGKTLFSERVTLDGLVSLWHPDLG